MRIERAVKAALPRLEGAGPGARGPRSRWPTSPSSLASGELAFSALTRAMAADGDVEEFAALERHVERLAGDPGARAWLKSVALAAGCGHIRASARRSSASPAASPPRSTTARSPRRSWSTRPDARRRTTRSSPTPRRSSPKLATPIFARPSTKRSRLQRRIDVLVPPAERPRAAGAARRRRSPALERVLASGEVVGPDRDRGVVARLRGMLRSREPARGLERIVQLRARPRGHRRSLSRVRLSRQASPISSARAAPAATLLEGARWVCPRRRRRRRSARRRPRALAPDRRASPAREPPHLDARPRARRRRAPDPAPRARAAPRRDRRSRRGDSGGSFEAICPPRRRRHRSARGARSATRTRRGDHALIAELLGAPDPRIRARPGDAGCSASPPRRRALVGALNHSPRGRGQRQAPCPPRRRSGTTRARSAISPTSTDRLGQPLGAGPLLPQARRPRRVDRRARRVRPPRLHDVPRRRRPRDRREGARRRGTARPARERGRAPGRARAPQGRRPRALRRARSSSPPRRASRPRTPRRDPRRRRSLRLDRATAWPSIRSAAPRSSTAARSTPSSKRAGSSTSSAAPARHAKRRPSSTSSSASKRISARTRSSSTPSCSRRSSTSSRAAAPACASSPAEHANEIGPVPLVALRMASTCPPGT